MGAAIEMGSASNVRMISLSFEIVADMYTRRLASVNVGNISTKGTIDEIVK
ncbi:hypothetical protein GCM10023156_10590 [Novipirellula rosea]|uniref:Uncharacterized protein n=1 Tax=Novipirellula rosea TaxID=1031540 RepID=A0ABP8MFD6_9BACT